MIHTINKIKYLGGYRLKLFFDNNKSGEVNLSNYLWGEVFEPLKDKAMFKKVAVNKELGTIVWPNGADIAPETLYKQAIG